MMDCHMVGNILAELIVYLLQEHMVVVPSRKER
jgi:hypothetical protein